MMLQHAFAYAITLDPAVKEQDFERYLLDKVFPSPEFSRRTIRDSAHSLLKGQGENGKAQYLWVLELDLMVSPNATDVVNPVDDTMQEKLDAYGTLSPAFTRVT